MQMIKKRNSLILFIGLISLLLSIKCKERNNIEYKYISLIYIDSVKVLNFFEGIDHGKFKLNFLSIQNCRLDTSKDMIILRMRFLLPDDLKSVINEFQIINNFTGIIELINQKYFFKINAWSFKNDADCTNFYTLLIKLKHTYSLNSSENDIDILKVSNQIFFITTLNNSSDQCRSSDLYFYTKSYWEDAQGFQINSIDATSFLKPINSQ